MARPTEIYLDARALLHNLQCVRKHAPGKKIIAMVKANAYGCGLSFVLPLLESKVEAFGVASMEEAIEIRNRGSRSEIIVFQGVYAEEEWALAEQYHLTMIIHQRLQLEWLLNTPRFFKQKVWVKVNTGMHRLGFEPTELEAVFRTLQSCPWVDEGIGLMTHLASADEWENSSNQEQLALFEALDWLTVSERSVANSAAILRQFATQAQVVRPGIMLYGVSPFADRTALECGLRPVVHFRSAISAIHRYPPGARVGYGGIWQSSSESVIGVVAVGYGDGYPRSIAPGTPVAIQGTLVPIVGRVSMDGLMVDLTACPHIKCGDTVELWGTHIPIEQIARSANTLAYELLCQLTMRPKRLT